MNLELVGRVAPVELTVSPGMLSSLSGFLHSSKARLRFRFVWLFRMLLCIVIDVDVVFVHGCTFSPCP